MAMPAAHAEWTVDMLDALPDDGNRYELIDGVLFVTPAPSDVHQLVVGALYVRLREYLVADRPQGSGTKETRMNGLETPRSWRYTGFSAPTVLAGTVGIRPQSGRTR